MNARKALKRLAAAGVRLSATGDKLRVETTRGLTDEQRGFLKKHKMELVTELRHTQALRLLTDDAHDAIHEAIEERAAIREFDGGEPRGLAERQARSAVRVYRYRLTDKPSTWLTMIAPSCDLEEARHSLELRFEERVLDVVEHRHVPRGRGDPNEHVEEIPMSTDQLPTLNNARVRCTDCAHGGYSTGWCRVARKMAGGRYLRSCEHFMDYSKRRAPVEPEPPAGRREEVLDQEVWEPDEDPQEPVKPVEPEPPAGRREEVLEPEVREPAGRREEVLEPEVREPAEDRQEPAEAEALEPEPCLLQTAKALRAAGLADDGVILIELPGSRLGLRTRRGPRASDVRLLVDAVAGGRVP